MKPADSHYCRALLAQASHFRRRGSSFFFVLLEWAGKARRAAMQPNQQPAQGELF